MFNRFNSKYSTFLTVLLIVAIVSIIGLLIFFGYDMYKKAFLTTEAGKIVRQFEDEYKEQDTNVAIDNNVVDNPFDLEAITSGNNGGKGGVVKYEDYVVTGVIKIPKIGREYPILARVTKRSIEIAVAIEYGPGPNEIGNTCIIGHNYRNGLFFSNLKNVNLGDTILITDNTGRTITYVVYNKYETTPNDSVYMSRDTNGKREISLSTCTDDGNNRLKLWAREQ